MHPHVGWLVSYSGWSDGFGRFVGWLVRRSLLQETDYVTLPCPDQSTRSATHFNSYVCHIWPLIYRYKNISFRGHKK